MSTEPRQDEKSANSRLSRDSGSSVLALDTASPGPAVTLLVSGSIFETLLPADRQASERLLAAVETCRGEAGIRLVDCERIAVCSGPGSFTGLRIGLATAWGLSIALDLPVETVSTLEAMAEAARGLGLSEVVAALDAGRGEVVLARFALETPRVRPLTPLLRLSREEAIARSRGGTTVSLPPGLLPGSEPPGIPLSRALAYAVSRAPRATTTPHREAVYGRLSAAEEKLGAP